MERVLKQQISGKDLVSPLLYILSGDSNQKPLRRRYHASKHHKTPERGLQFIPQNNSFTLSFTLKPCQTTDASNYSTILACNTPLWAAGCDSPFHQHISYGSLSAILTNGANAV